MICLDISAFDNPDALFRRLNADEVTIMQGGERRAVMVHPDLYDLLEQYRDEWEKRNG